MRRFLVASLLLVGACSSDGGTGDDWVVAVTGGDRTRVEPCLSIDGITEAVDMGGSDVQPSGLYRVTTREQGDAVALCFEAQGFDAEVRQTTESDRAQFP